MEYIVIRTDSLTHHGVKGMKWGVRRYQNADGTLTPAGKKKYGDTEYGRAKVAFKVAKKDYKKAFNKASNYSSAHPISQWTNKKKSNEADKRWEDTINKADKLNTAKSNYKQAKAERKENIKNVYKDIQKKSSFGDRILYNDATRKKAAQYVVDRNMSVDEARKKANKVAIRNTGIILATYGGIAAASLYKANH